MKTEKNYYFNNSILLFVTFLISLFVYFCTVREYGFNVLGLVLLIICVIIEAIYFLRKKWFDDAIEFIVKYRYVIALICFVICVLFKIHGSSIGMFDEVIPQKKDNTVNGVVFGKSKGIRSDEWQIMTPYNLSQKYNNYQVDSKIVSLDGQNMIIGFNSAVFDITILGKPLVWGYLLFGNDYGLSWYWSLKTVLFVLFSFEILNILTKNKKISIFGSLLITLGPSTQWWFAPHMPDVMLWFMVLFTMLYYLVSSKKTWLKNLLVIVMPFVVLEYVVALFPSFQVGLGYFMLAVFLAVMYRDNNKFYSKKGNIIRIVLIGIISAGLVGYFLVNNLDALKALNDTVYPGSRLALGGVNTVKDLFTDLGTPFLGYTDRILYGNQCEDSTFIHFGIFFILLFPLIFKLLRKKQDKDYIIGSVITGIMLIYAYFMIVGFPEFLAKLTLFKYINRMNIIYGFISVIYTVWSLNALSKVRDEIDVTYFISAVIAYVLFYFSFINDALKQYMPIYFYYIEIFTYALILIMLHSKNFKKLSYTIILSLLVFSAISINPVVSGISALSNHPSTDFIQETIEKDKDSYWIGYNSFGYPSYLISIGAKTANAMNFYPDLKKWEIIDPEKKFIDNWNRYSYVITTFTKDENYVANLTSPDVINLSINNETVEKLNVKYILTSASEDLSVFDDDKYQYVEIYKDDSVKVYQFSLQEVSRPNARTVKKQK